MIQTVPGSKVAGILKDDEKDLLAKDIEATIRAYKSGLIFAWLSVFLIIGILVVPAMYLAIHRMQNRLRLITDTKLEIFEVTGTLSRKHNVAKAGFTSLYTCYVGGHLIPSQALPNPMYDESGILGHAGEIVTVQYIPTISRYRSYTDLAGKGYNFITKTPI